MKVIYDLGTTKFKKTTVAIGVFDGVHRGHQLLIKSAVAQAKKIKAKAMVITFFPHPAHVLSKAPALPYLMSLEHRLDIFKQMGVDVVWVVRFNKKFAQLNPAQFIEDILVKKLSVKDIYVGEDFRFGKDRMGGITLFKSLSLKGGYRIHPLKALRSGGEIISSGRLRRLIPQGNLKTAAALLGRPVSVQGKVVKGDARGKALGFPTANIQCTSDVLPPNGVYAVRVVWKNKILYGMANLGLRPTFKDPNPQLHLEVNIFDFNRNLYGQTLLVEFLKKTRDEQRFSSKDALISQIRKDEQVIRKFFK